MKYLHLIHFLSISFILFYYILFYFKSKKKNTAMYFILGEVSLVVGGVFVGLKRI